MLKQKWLMQLVIVLCFVGSVFAIPSNGPYTLYNGLVSFSGTMVDGVHIPSIEMLEHWDDYSDDIQLDFADVYNTFHARAIRLIVHSMIPEWDNVGMDFPTPTATEIANLGGIIDAAAEEGLQVYLVFVLPEEYRLSDPDIADTFYANNNQSLISNLYTFWNNIFGQVVSSRVNEIMGINILGDFDPLDVYGRYTPTQLEHHREWWRRIWPNFYCWFDYIPVAKKSFEVIGGVSDPMYYLNQEIDWCQAEISSHGWSPPNRWGTEIYACTYWLDTYPDWWTAYITMIQSLANNVGGYNHLMLEEIGVNDGCGDCLDDGMQGEAVFSASFAALHYLNGTTVPIGVWAYCDTPSCNHDGQFGLYDTDGNLKQGWWVLPWYFSND